MIYKFNNLEIDSKNYRLLKDGNEIAVEPQVFNLIVLLLENKQNVVSRDEILDKLWQGRVVSDTSINNHIKSARKVLGDDGIKQAVIKTIHSRGYQFIAEIKEDFEIIDTNKSTFTPTKYRSNILVLSTLIVLIFFAIKYYQKTKLHQTVENIASYQELSYSTFVAQAKRRNELVEMIEARIGEKREMQFEKYFSYYFEKLNNQEIFVFDQIRAMTETGLYQNNLKIVDELNKHPKIFKEIKGTKELQQHLTFWLNKYHSIFLQRKDMCLLYVGVEDGVPYPNDVNQNIITWLDNSKEHDKLPNKTMLEVSDTHSMSALEQIVVLPFANTKPDVDTDFLGFALATQIISDLTYLNKFSIRPAGSIRKYVNQVVDPMLIGQKLQVDYVLSGNYLKENDKIRLNIELISVTSNQLIWRESIQVDYSSTFTLQDMVAQKVAHGLNVSFKNEFLNQEYKDTPNSALAYEYYLRGISYPYNNAGHKLAIEMLDKSIELDPSYAPTYAHLGMHLRLYEQHGLVALTREKEAQWYYKKALQLNPNLLMALKNLSSYYVEINKVEEAYKLASRLKEIAPNSVETHNTLSYIYRYVGMNKEAINEIEAALTLSPNNPRLATIIPIYMAAGLPQKALSYLPIASPPYANIHGGIIEFNRGNIKQANNYFQKIIADKEGGVWELYANFYLSVIAENKEKARQFLIQITKNKIVDGENYFYEATSFALLGDIEDSINMLEKAVDIGFFNYPYINTTPEFKILSDEPRFQTVLHKAKKRHESFKEQFF